MHQAVFQTSEWNTKKCFAMRFHQDSIEMKACSDIIDSQEALRNSAKITLGDLFPDVHEHDVAWKHGHVMGWQRHGETELFKFLMECACLTYGMEKVNVCCCNDLTTAFDHLDTKDAPLIIIDECETNELFELDKESLDSEIIFQQVRCNCEKISEKKSARRVKRVRARA